MSVFACVPVCLSVYLSSHLLLTAVWVEEALAGGLDRLEGSGKLRLVHKTWSPCNAGWIRDTHQVCRLETKQNKKVTYTCTISVCIQIYARDIDFLCTGLSTSISQQ